MNAQQLGPIVEYTGEKLISLDVSGAHVLSQEVANKIAKKNLSPSAITSLLEGCGGRWLADQYVVSKVVEQEPDNAARRGSLFHKVMENLFAYPAEERTIELMKKLVNATLKEPEFVDLSTNRDVVLWLRAAINGYYNMGGDPTKVTIAELTEGKPNSGLEFFVKGHLGETATRNILGFIDQVILDPTRDDGSVIIQDWKTGAKAKKWNPKTKGDDGLAEQRQQIIYSELLRQQGIKVSGARLIFPVAGTVIDVELGDADLRESVLAAVDATDKVLDTYIENNTFELKPTFLCHYCPLAKICPSAGAGQGSFPKPYDKTITAYASQPEPEVLLQAVELL